jgi:hypothetical protein
MFPAPDSDVCRTRVPDGILANIQGGVDGRDQLVAACDLNHGQGVRCGNGGALRLAPICWRQRRDLNEHEPYRLGRERRHPYGQ